MQTEPRLKNISIRLPVRFVHRADDLTERLSVAQTGDLHAPLLDNPGRSTIFRVAIDLGLEALEARYLNTKRENRMKP